ncbi:ABC transporter permease subunit [Alphaproteobacteria bacterium HT1-32]|nr:ABC transporter permease subunit [Alphaproteobacteria bacterium HT1-32]
MDFSLLVYGDTGWGDEMLVGGLMTIAIATCSFLLGIVFAVAAAAAKLSQSILFRGLAAIYTTVIRGIPELLIIYLVFFGAGQLMRSVATLFGYTEYFDLPIFVTGMICIGASSGAYSTEVIRGAVLAIPRGQLEAGKAIGMDKWLMFWRILVPQAARFALPGLGNIWQVTLKETALISVIGLADVMRKASEASGSTKEPFTFYFTALIIFYVITKISGRGFIFAERRANKGVRRA